MIAGAYGAQLPLEASDYNLHADAGGRRAAANERQEGEMERREQILRETPYPGI